jgi:hypothetical protein
MTTATVSEVAPSKRYPYEGLIITPALLKQVRKVFANQGQEVSYDSKHGIALLFPKGSNTPIPDGAETFYALAQTLAAPPQWPPMTAREKRRAAKAAKQAKVQSAQETRAAKFASLPAATRSLILNHLTYISSEATQSAADFIDNLEEKVYDQVADAVKEFGQDVILAAYDTGRIPDIVSTDATIHLRWLAGSNGFENQITR